MATGSVAAPVTTGDVLAVKLEPVLGLVVGVVEIAGVVTILGVVEILGVVGIVGVVIIVEVVGIVEVIVWSIA